MKTNKQKSTSPDLRRHVSEWGWTQPLPRDHAPCQENQKGKIMWFGSNPRTEKLSSSHSHCRLLIFREINFSFYTLLLCFTLPLSPHFSVDSVRSTFPSPAGIRSSSGSTAFAFALALLLTWSHFLAQPNAARHSAVSQASRIENLENVKQTEPKKSNLLLCPVTLVRAETFRVIEITQSLYGKRRSPDCKQYKIQYKSEAR